MSNLLFSTVNFPDLDCKKASEEILKVDKQNWFRDDYRITNMLPLMTMGGLPGHFGTRNNRNSQFRWLWYTPDVVKNWFDDYVFPWMGQQSRVMALLTEPNFSNGEHIDCNPEHIGSRQHKFRVVLQGRTDTLYFITDKGNVAAPNITGPFLMDGSWPHGMYNNTNEIKLTIAVGAPWTGNEHYTNTTDLMFKDQYKMPEDLNKYFKKDY